MVRCVVGTTTISRIHLPVPVPVATFASVTITRWTRYGRDRLYVHGDDGSDLGWWDLQQNEAHPTTPGALADLSTAVTQWQLDRTTTSAAARRPAAETDHTNSTAPRAEPPTVAQASGSRSPSTATSSTPSVLPPVVDLAYNAPGAQLRGQVEAARAAGQKPTLLRRIFLGKHAYSTWERGLIGEQLVEAELRKLVQIDPWWGFINSIPVGENGADIDHLVVGLAGVFTINTKYHRGCNVWVAGNTYMVNGQRQPFIHNSRHEANRAAKLLSRACGFDIRVHGLVVPTQARSFTVREQPVGVRVVNRARLASYLGGLPQSIQPGQREQILAAARLASTWRP